MTPLSPPSPAWLGGVRAHAIFGTQEAAIGAECVGSPRGAPLRRNRHGVRRIRHLWRHDVPPRRALSRSAGDHRTQWGTRAVDPKTLGRFRNCRRCFDRLWQNCWLGERVRNMRHMRIVVAHYGGPEVITAIEEDIPT